MIEEGKEILKGCDIQIDDIEGLINKNEEFMAEKERVLMDEFVSDNLKTDLNHTQSSPHLNFKPSDLSQSSNFIMTNPKQEKLNQALKECQEKLLRFQNKRDGCFHPE